MLNNFSTNYFSELRTPWQFTDYVRPICLPGLNLFPNAGTVCKVAGWGSIHAALPGEYAWDVQMSRVLRAVYMPIIEQAQCHSHYRDQITRRMFCAGYPEGGRDACQVKPNFIEFFLKVNNVTANSPKISSGRSS